MSARLTPGCIFLICVAGWHTNGLWIEKKRGKKRGEVVWSRGEMGNERKGDERRLRVAENGLHRRDGGDFVVGVLHKTSEMAHLTAPYCVALAASFSYSMMVEDGSRAWDERFIKVTLTSSLYLAGDEVGGDLHHKK